MTRAQHTAGISDVESLMFVNRIREMASVELGKEIEKDVFSSCHEKTCSILLQKKSTSLESNSKRKKWRAGILENYQVIKRSKNTWIPPVG